MSVAGATGVIGARLVPLLDAAGHIVAAMTRFETKVGMLQSLGATPVICDVYDTVSLTTAIAAFHPDIVIHQLTDLPDDARDLSSFGATNSRIRRKGTRNLLTAAKEGRATSFVCQSVAWKLPADWGGAVTDMEDAVLASNGVVVRYGQFYGPGTYHEHEPPAHPRIHIDDAARRTIPALQLSRTTITIVEG